LACALKLVVLDRFGLPTDVIKSGNRWDASASTSVAISHQVAAQAGMTPVDAGAPCCIGTPWAERLPWFS